jgi:hypothetical protein
MIVSLQSYLFVPFISLTFYAFNPKGSDSDEDAASKHGASDDSCCSPKIQPAKKRRRKGSAKEAANVTTDATILLPPAKKRGNVTSISTRAKKSKLPANSGGKKTFTVEGVLLSFPEKTEYGT